MCKEYKGLHYNSFDELTDDLKNKYKGRKSQ